MFRGLTTTALIISSTPTLTLCVGTELLARLVAVVTGELLSAGPAFSLGSHLRPIFAGLRALKQAGAGERTGRNLGSEEEKKTFSGNLREEDKAGRRWGILNRDFQTNFTPCFPPLRPRD